MGNFWLNKDKENKKDSYGFYTTSLKDNWVVTDTTPLSWYTDTTAKPISFTVNSSYGTYIILTYVAAPNTTDKMGYTTNYTI